MSRAMLVTALVLAAACDGPSKVVGVECSSDSDCRLPNVDGRCEATMFCSYPDPSCNGNRYTPGATGGLGNTCVEPAAACGEKDQPCCANDLCGSDLACTSDTCVCGGEGEPCCTGTTCEANLACAASATCECGGIDEPCCGGSTCDTGLSCASGSCTGGVLEVAAGENHTCALRSNRQVTCWGHDWKGYAVHTKGMSVPVIASITPIVIPNLTDVAEIRAGGRHTCAKKLDGTLWCWGHNESGQLGDGTTTSTLSPVQVLGMSNVTLFDLAKYHTCAQGMVAGVSALYCWGHAGEGTRHETKVPPQLSRLGNNDILDKHTPVRVDLSIATSAGQTIRALSTGSHHSCVALSDNTVWCWGKNDQGQLGNGTTTHSKVPVAADLSGVTIPAGTLVEGVAASGGNFGKSTCLRLSNGEVYCWGTHDDGQLGDGTVATGTARTAPTAPIITTPLGAAKLVDIVGGSGGYCGRANDGTGWCWGSGFRGRNGNNSGSNQTSMVQVIGLSGAIQISTQNQCVCAVTSNNKLFCWGNNKKSQCTATPTGSPPHVTQATEVVL